MLCLSPLRSAVAFLLVAGATIVPLDSAFASIRVRLMYDDELTLGIGPVHTSSELDFVLNGKDVNVYAVDGSSATLVASKMSGTGFYYGPISFRVGLKPNVIDFTAFYNTHKTHTQIRTDGRSSCTASIVTTLRPGAKNFEYEIPSYGSVNVYKINLSNIRCSLSTE